MYCKKCGRKMGEEDRFCGYCGTMAVGETEEKEPTEDLNWKTEESEKNVETEGRTREELSFDWNLDGFPSSEQKRTDTVDFDWNSVIDEKDRERYNSFFSKDGDKLEIRTDLIKQELDETAYKQEPQKEEKTVAGVGGENLIDLILGRHRNDENQAESHNHEDEDILQSSIENCGDEATQLDFEKDIYKDSAGEEEYDETDERDQTDEVNQEDLQSDEAEFRNITDELPQYEADPAQNIEETSEEEAHVFTDAAESQPTAIEQEEEAEQVSEMATEEETDLPEVSMEEYEVDVEVPELKVEDTEIQEEISETEDDTSEVSVEQPQGVNEGQELQEEEPKIDLPEVSMEEYEVDIEVPELKVGYPEEQDEVFMEEDKLPEVPEDKSDEHTEKSESEEEQICFEVPELKEEELKEQEELIEQEELKEQEEQQLESEEPEEIINVTDISDLEPEDMLKDYINQNTEDEDKEKEPAEDKQEEEHALTEEEKRKNRLERATLYYKMELLKKLLELENGDISEEELLSHYEEE